MSTAHWLSFGVLLAEAVVLALVAVTQGRYHMNVHSLMAELAKLIRAGNHERAVKLCRAAGDNLPASVARSLLEAREKPWRWDYLTHVAIRRCHDLAARLRPVTWLVAALSAGLLVALIPLWQQTESNAWIVSLVALASLVISGAAVGYADKSYDTTVATAVEVMTLRNLLYEEAGYYPPTIARLAGEAPTAEPAAEPAAEREPAEAEPAETPPQRAEPAETPPERAEPESAPPESEGIRLDIYADGALSRTQTIDRDVIKVGSLPSCHLCLTGERTVGNLHGFIEWAAGVWQVVDLGSKHGTTLNGEAVSRAVLSEGDELRFGDTVVVVARLSPPTS